MDKTMKKIMEKALLFAERGIPKVEINHALEAIFVRKTHEQIDFISQKAIEMWESFNTAVDEAGGGGWNVDDLLNMSVLDLFSSLATNNVRFIYKK